MINNIHWPHKFVSYFGFTLFPSKIKQRVFRKWIKYWKDVWTFQNWMCKKIGYAAVISSYYHHNFNAYFNIGFHIKTTEVCDRFEEMKQQQQQQQQQQ